MMKLSRIFLLMIMSFFVTVNAVSLNVKAAEQTEVSGIEISIASDKGEYTSGEDANISFTIRNNSSNNLDVLNWDLKVPDGLSLKNGDISGRNIKINSGEALEGSVVLVKDTTTSTSSTTSTTTSTTTAIKTDSAKTGDDTNIFIPLTIIISSVVLAFITRKKGKKTIRFLCLLLCINCIAVVSPSEAFSAEDNCTASSVEKSIKIDNSDYKIEFSISFDPESFEVTVSNQLYAWADYNKKDNVISINWIKQEDAVSYNVYERSTSERALAEVKDKTEYVYRIKDADARDEYTFVIKKNSEKERAISNNVVVKRGKNGIYSFVDIDSDEDGLNDLKEINLKTDRLVSDTDNDGVVDGYEFYKLRTDPLLVASNESGISDGADDFDGDGLTNSQEYLYSTDPFEGDTDFDGFPDGYEISHNMDPLSFDSISFDKINVSEIADYGEYDLEILNLTEENPVDILYNEEGLVQTIRGVFSEREVKCAKDAYYAICNVRTLLGIQDPINEIRYSKFVSGKYTNSYLFDYEYKGIRLYGKDVTVTCDLDGKVLSIKSYYINHDDIEEININPAISETELKNIIHKANDNSGEIVSSDLYIKADDELMLVYCVKTTENEIFWINAHSGEIIIRDKTSSISYASEDIKKGEDGNDYKYPVAELPVADGYVREDNEYFMYDESRNLALYEATDFRLPDIYDRSDGKIPYSYSKEGPLAEAVSTYYNAIQVYDWYSKRGYKGLNGKGGPVAVFFNDPGLELSSKNFIGDVDGDGMYWKDSKKEIDSSGNFECIDFGNHSSGKKSEGSYLDFIGHEYGHGVVFNRIKFDYSEAISTNNQMKTINEAYADIFGSCVNGSWMQHNIPFRNVTNPHASGNPVKYNDNSIVTVFDSKEDKLVKEAAFDPKFTDEHRNSTVISYAAYLMNNKYGVEMEDIWTLFSESIKNLESSTSLLSIRDTLLTTAMETSAINRNKVISAIKLAFNDVGISGQTGSVRILVIDVDKPVSNALVSIIKNGSVVRQISTDSSGIVNFEGLEIGTYDVKVLYSVEKNLAAQVTIQPNKTITKTIRFISGSTDFEWKEYDHINYVDRWAPTLPKHIDIGETDIVMTGYSQAPLKDFLLVKENDKLEKVIHSPQKVISFTLEKDEGDDPHKYKNNWHTMEGGGFLFDVSVSGEDEEKGTKGKISAHCLLVTQKGLKLCYLNNVDIDSLCDGKYRNLLDKDCVYISNFEEHNRVDYVPQSVKLSEKTFPIADVTAGHSFKIRIDKSNKEYITVWDNQNIIINHLCINKLDGDIFGPITSHDKHDCEQISKFTFSNIRINLISAN